MACTVSIDVADYPYGTASYSLHMLNPILLVPLANVQVSAGQYADAVRSAADALEPAAIEEARWPALKQQLTASSYCVSGAEYLTQSVLPW
jgi:hypothetical protein